MILGGANYRSSRIIVSTWLKGPELWSRDRSDSNCPQFSGFAHAPHVYVARLPPAPFTHATRSACGLRFVCGLPDRSIQPRPRNLRTRNEIPGYHGIVFLSRRNLPLKDCGASAASQTIPDAPSATERVAFAPPISVRTQPGQTELIAKSGNAAASWTVTSLNPGLPDTVAGCSTIV